MATLKIGTRSIAIAASAVALIVAAPNTPAYSSPQSKLRPAHHALSSHWRYPRPGIVYGAPAYGTYGGPTSYGPPAYAYRGPGYLYAPGRGIVDEACNLPTSACPNEMRDVQ
jgi:hypothetical protein